MAEYNFNNWPVFSDEEIKRASDILLSGKVNYWTGKETSQFEHEFAQAVGCKYGVAVTNGSVALELALRAKGVGKGHEVIVTPRSFFASASSIMICGALPVFADVDLISQNITAESIEKVISENTKAVVCVHLSGWPCDMDPILNLSEKYGFYVIEDCAQAHGAYYKGKPVGSFGHAAAWSFCQDKIMTTGGEGGMLTTNDREVWSKVWSYKDHGKTWDAVHSRKHKPGYRWLHERIGTNYRITEIQAAIGRLQLERLEEWVKKRRKNAEFLTESFRSLNSLRVIEPEDEIFHSYYKYYVFVKPEYLKPQWDRDRIMKAVNESGVPCMTGTCPEIYLEKVFENSKSRPLHRLPNAKELSETSLMFQVHPTMGEKEMERTVSVLKEIITKSGK